MVCLDCQHCVYFFAGCVLLDLSKQKLNASYCDRNDWGQMQWLYKAQSLTLFSWCYSGYSQIRLSELKLLLCNSQIFSRTPHHLQIKSILLGWCLRSFIMSPSLPSVTSAPWLSATHSVHQPRAVCSFYSTQKARKSHNSSLSIYETPTVCAA